MVARSPQLESPMVPEWQRCRSCGCLLLDGKHDAPRRRGAWLWGDAVLPDILPTRGGSRRGEVADALQEVGAENPDRAKFCVECAAPFPRSCPSCNAENPPTAKFCLECAKPLRAAAQPSKSVTPDSGGIRVKNSDSTSGEVDGERKTVTALFADIKGSMELIQDLDPEEARAIV